MAINGKKQMSPLGLGCWPLGGDQWGPPQTDHEYISTLRSAYDAGITHFDTAQAYGRGHGEELVGKALKDVRDHVIIATKAMFTPGEKVEAAVNASLKRLQTEFIDIFYIHWPKKNGDLAGMMEALERLRRKGMVRRIGVSNFSIADMQAVMKTGVIDYCQICYNLLWRKEERETIPFCVKNGVGIVTYSSLAEGILTGKFSDEPDFPSGDHRKFTALFKKELWPKVYATVEKLKRVAVDERVTLSNCAIRWLLAREGVVSVLAGASNPEQVASNVRALDYGAISSRLLDRMTEISNEFAPAIPGSAGNIFGWYP